MEEVAVRAILDELVAKQAWRRLVKVGISLARVSQRTRVRPS
jgi:hypothetical protein